MKSMIRFGIIGYGLQGRLYASILQGQEIPGLGVVPLAGNCLLTAVCDRSTNLSDNFTDDAIHTFEDWKALIDADVCDAVILTVPHFLHPVITLYAFEHGLHVLCEKPAAIRASSVTAMIQSSQEHPELAFGLVLNQRTNPIFQHVKSRIDSGELGTIRRSNWIINSWWRPDSYYESSPWRGTWGGEGGGLLVNQAPHQLDLWTWICGIPKSVYATCIEGAHRHIHVDNDVTLMTEYENGATGCFISSTHDPLGTNRLEIDLSKGKIIIEDGQKATITRFKQDESEWNQSLDFKSLMTLRRASPEQLYEVEKIDGTLPYGEDYSLIFSNFADHILNQTPLIAPGIEGLIPVQLSNTAYLSSYYRKPLAFPCDMQAYDAYLDQRIQEEKSMSTALSIHKLAHVAFNANHVDDMIHFYCDILGMTHLFTSTYKELANSMRRKEDMSPSEDYAKGLHTIEEKGESPWAEYLKLADRQFMEFFHSENLSSDLIDNASDYYGYMKLNYEVADIHRLKEQLLSHGVTIDTDIHTTVDGSTELVIHDPDGNEVQFTEYSPSSRSFFGLEAPVLPEDGSNPLIYYTTQVAYQVNHAEDMYDFYTKRLGLPCVRTLTFADLAQSMLSKNPGSEQTERSKQLLQLGDAPWIHFIEIAPHQYIELFHTPGQTKKERPSTYGFYGYQHICLEVTDIHEAWEAVLANGLTPDTPISLGADGSYQFWLVDPDGNRIEIMAYTENSKQLVTL